MLGAHERTMRPGLGEGQRIRIDSHRERERERERERVRDRERPWRLGGDHSRRRGAGASPSWEREVYQAC